MLTAGPTHEMLDPVRFIGNYSSGKMGFALAEELANQGAKVNLVCGPVALNISHPLINRIDVVSGKDMYQKCMDLFPECDGAIMAAAVADYAPVKFEKQKIKRSGENYTIELTSNPDIAASLGRIKRNNQVLIGFALETENEEENAVRKLEKKNLDFIVLNSLNDLGAGFQVDTNRIKIITHSGEKICYDLKSKKSVAKDIIEKMIETMNNVSSV